MTLTYGNFTVYLFTLEFGFANVKGNKFLRVKECRMVRVLLTRTTAAFVRQSSLFHWLSLSWQGTER